MCFYKPNKPPCTCNFLQLVQPCNQAEFYPSLAPPPLSPPQKTSSLFDSPSAAAVGLDHKQGGGMLVQLCPNRYITYEAGERYCLKCCRLRPGRMGMEAGAGARGFEDSPFNDHAQQHSVPVENPSPIPPTPPLHRTRPRRFKRQPVSSPVMRLRLKWKESLVRSVADAAAEAAAEALSASAQKDNDDPKSLLMGSEIMGLGITVSEDGSGRWCLSDNPGAGAGAITAGGRRRRGLGSGFGGQVNRSYRGVEFGRRVHHGFC